MNTVSFQRCWRCKVWPCCDWWGRVTEWGCVIWWKLVGDPTRLETWMLPVCVGDGVSSPRTSISSSSESTGASLLARDSRPPLNEKSTGLSAINSNKHFSHCTSGIVQDRFYIHLTLQNSKARHCILLILSIFLCFESRYKEFLIFIFIINVIYYFYIHY